jgi:hypothetical protein
MGGNLVANDRAGGREACFECIPRYSAALNRGTQNQYVGFAVIGKAFYGGVNSISFEHGRAESIPVNQIARHQKRAINIEHVSVGLYCQNRTTITLS